MIRVRTLPAQPVRDMVSSYKSPLTTQTFVGKRLVANARGGMGPLFGWLDERFESGRANNSAPP